MITVAELLNNLAGKAGISLDNAKLKALVGSSNLNIEVPEEVETALQQKLLTMDSAKSNSELKSHFYALAYNGLDSELARMMQDFELDDATKSELLGEKSTTQRAVKLTKKIQELESKKANAKAGDKADLQKQIDELNAEKAKQINEHKEALNRTKSEYDAREISLLLNNELGGYNYAFPKEMPLKSKIAAVRSILDSEFNTKGVKIVNENGELKLQTKDGTDFYDANHKKHDLKSFLDSTLSNSKLLVTNDPGGSNDGGGNNGGANNPPNYGGNNGGGANKKVNRSAMADIDEELAAFQRATV